jgi:hypothetical protein
VYWDANASPRERMLCWEKKAVPPLSSRLLSIRERLLANAQSEVRRAQWVRTYLAMSISPSHPQHHTGGSQGPMAPSPAAHWVSRPSSSMAQTPTPARLTKNAPSLRPIPLHHSQHEGEQAWQSIELPSSSSVGNGASGFVAGSTSRLC